MCRDSSTTGKMLKGISDFQIKSPIENLNDNDINENFIGVFPANHMNKFIDYRSLIFEKKASIRFQQLILTSTEKNSTHWWSILDIEPKTDLFFFGSFGIKGLENFIIQGDKNIIKNILNGIEKMTRTDKKLMLVNIKFSKDAFKI